MPLMTGDQLKLEKAICDALGVDVELVKTLTLRLRAGELPVVDIEMFVRDDVGEFTGAIEAITWGPVQEPPMSQEAEGVKDEQIRATHHGLAGHEFLVDHSSDHKGCSHPDCVNARGERVESLDAEAERQRIRTTHETDDDGHWAGRLSDCPHDDCQSAHRERERIFAEDGVTISESTLQFILDLRDEIDVEISVTDGSELSTVDQERLRDAIRDHTTERGVKPKLVRVTPVGMVIVGRSGHDIDNDTVPIQYSVSRAEIIASTIPPMVYPRNE